MPQNPEGHLIVLAGHPDEFLSQNRSQNRNQSLQHHKAPPEEDLQGQEEGLPEGHRAVAEEESPMLLAVLVTEPMLLATFWLSRAALHQAHLDRVDPHKELDLATPMNALMETLMTEAQHREDPALLKPLD